MKFDGTVNNFILLHFSFFVEYKIHQITSNLNKTLTNGKLGTWTQFQRLLFNEIHVNLSYNIDNLETASGESTESKVDSLVSIFFNHLQQLFH